MSVRDSLIEAKSVWEANYPRWSFHMAVDYSSGDEVEEVYQEMMKILKASLPQVPKVQTDIVRWSKFADRAEINALFDRAIAKAED